MTAQSYHVADLFEAVADAVPARTAIVCGATRRTYRELDDRASRLASWMRDRGVDEGTSVGLQLSNVAEHVEAALAVFKLGASPVNLNYRLTATELSRLYRDAELVGVVHGHEFTALAENAASDLGRVWTLATGDPYEEGVRSASPAARSIRSEDLPYVLYTGGTTGYPKGVEWRTGDAFFACLGGGDPTGMLGPITQPAQIVDRITDDRAFLPAPPLIHAAGMWTTLRWLLAGAKVVLIPTFDPAAIVEAISVEKVTHMNIVGDAMAVRILGALREHDTARVDSLELLASGGAPLSEPVRRILLDRLPLVRLRDSYGSSETGVHGWASHDAHRQEGCFATVDTLILDPDTLAPVPPGSDRAGLVARTRHVPIRYRNDAAASAKTFITVDHQRCAVTGDMGRMDADGCLTLYGRGSTSINSGGEKIFPEEVESVIREIPEVLDCLVLGMPDDRWGQRVTAMVALGASSTTDASVVREHCRARIAGFKVPKDVHVVDHIPRTASGKPDYARATRMLTGDHGDVLRR